MNMRVTRPALAIILTITAQPSFADVAWLPSPAVLRALMCDSKWVVIGRLIDVDVEDSNPLRFEGEIIRSGSGRLAIDRIIAGTDGALPAVQWSDRSTVICPRLQLDQFNDQLGVWFVRVDATGAFDPYGSEFWTFRTIERALRETEKAGALTPELQALQQAINERSRKTGQVENMECVPQSYKLTRSARRNRGSASGSFPSTPRSRAVRGRSSTPGIVSLETERSAPPAVPA